MRNPRPIPDGIAAHVARRDEMAAETVARTGIDDAMIERLVHAFYARVRYRGDGRPDEASGPAAASG